MKNYSDEDFETKKTWKKEKKRIAAKDRSKYKKTDKDKRQKQAFLEKLRRIEDKNLLQGRVLAIFPEEISVQHGNEIFSCTLKGSLKQEFGEVKNLAAVGDLVLFDPTSGAIHHIEDRYSVLSRKEHGQSQQQLIAANIDQVLIVVSVGEPPLKPALVDRYIISSLKGKMRPVIIVNKIDLLSDPEEKTLLTSFIAIYRKLEFPVLLLSAKTDEGIDSLKEVMRGRTSVFSGQSGVGKSSLINKISSLNLPTRNLSKKTGKGAHTTSKAHLIPLEFGGWCIDTPGIRSFGVWDLQREDLALFFYEIAESAKTCKYPDCTHCHEPECAVKIAVERGEISSLRYDSYQKLLLEVKK